MNQKSILVTGSNGLIGGEVVDFFSSNGYTVYGIDNNQREQFFGKDGNTLWNKRRLTEKWKKYHPNNIDIRNRDIILQFIEELRPSAIVHTAAQPSHDRAAEIPFDDFDVNASGTLNLLEATRRYCAESPFVHMSTNKVYGDAPNKLPLVENTDRWDFASQPWTDGIPETLTIDQSKHSLFGASKLAADIMVQEYGRYFGIPTCCLRGGCLTGPAHSGVKLHGFLSYLIRCNVQSTEYTVFGYKGKQVRDNIHAYDVASFIWEFITAPKPGEVYNIGGGKDNSLSIIEAFSHAESVTGRTMNFKYIDTPRAGDHIVYYSNLDKIRSDYPNWKITYGLERIITEIAESWQDRLSASAKTK